MNEGIVVALHGFFGGSPVLSFVAAFFAEWFPYLLIVLAAAYVFIRRLSKGMIQPLFFAFAPATFAWFLADAIKHFYPIARPFQELGLTPLVSVDDPMGSFPSGHATAFAALAMTIFLRDRKAGSWFLLGALIIGLARIMVGVHWPSDILAGFLLGGLIAFLAHYVVLKFLK